jgi:AraC-like ligand binding domain
MSQMRQGGFFDRSHDRKSAIATLTRDYPAGHVVPLHFHDRDQLVYASRGVMTVRTRDGTWVVPPHRAVWIPSGVPHSITMSGSVAMRTLYLKPRLAKTLPRDCCVMNVSSLLKELVLYACTLRALTKTVRWQSHLIAVIPHFDLLNPNGGGGRQLHFEDSFICCRSPFLTCRSSRCVLMDFVPESFALRRAVPTHSLNERGESLEMLYKKHTMPETDSAIAAWLACMIDTLESLSCDRRGRSGS